MQNITNYISNILQNSVDDVYNKLPNETKDILNNNINDIINIFDPILKNISFKSYNDNINYKLIERKKHFFDIIPNGFSSSKHILNMLNEIMVYNLKFNEYNIKITIYHNDNDNINILNNNIKKIMVRIYNLLLLYKNKVYTRHNKKISLPNYEYVFYLYSNPRRSNGKLSGKEYLKNISNCPFKCFNVYSGQTMDDDLIIYVSRLEEALGLLTHEALHAAGLIYMKYHEQCLSSKNFNIFEMFTNAFASIIHSYLTSFETQTNVYDILKYEFYHALLHSVRISINTNITIMDIINGNNKWTQNALLYEYVNGRCLILLFFKYLYENEKYNKAMNNMLSLTDAWDIENNKMNLTAKKMIDDIHSKKTTEKYMEILESIHNIFLKNIELKKNDNKDSLNGNMIQQYFLHDTMEIEDKNKNTMLYGGKIDYKHKYFVYCKKYLRLLKKLSHHN
ncbi:hypothetical protein BMW23_1065 [Bodo saltans virus]|uniref:Uncharacterized protein n=1 Tax=Bodo saltans virus TaxID=2024608 RepID=A0A2H4UWJ5_9VIRU|nr:hypothetical protein QJ851_gp1046 [Bodo saltans virus]ATZ81109.1 hypothetical protein BMW23_1065 [Bodo saltans virus]